MSKEGNVAKLREVRARAKEKEKKPNLLKKIIVPIGKIMYLYPKTMV
jgi:hypothetical protein